jgi:deoxyribonuclease-4
MVVAHDSYLINIASPDSALWKKSMAALREEMERAEQLQIPLLIMHPGSHTGAGVDDGLRSVSRALNQLLQGTAGFGVRIVLENTAGQGTALGHSFQHLARLVGDSIHPERLGVCLDTCHAFAAGYDLSHKVGYSRVLDEFNQILGLGLLKVLHLNDSKKGLGSRVDRHEHMGRGMIGLECFRLIMNDARFKDIPKLIETPNELEGVEMDPVNLSLLREMVGQSGRG